MKKNRFAQLIKAPLLLFLMVSVPLAYFAQSGDKKPVVFKSPTGYMPAEFSGHAGKLLLDPGRPAGMFVGYPKEGQDMNAFSEELKGTVAGMFLHEVRNPTWTSAPLPAHNGIESESGSLMTTSDDKMELQLAFYSRAEGVAYGYFAMRYKKPKGDDAKFLDASGGGVKAFDELVKSISKQKK